MPLDYTLFWSFPWALVLMVYCSLFPMKKRKEKKKSELNAQSFTCILFRFNKVFYRFEFIKYIYIYIFWSLSSKNEKLKKKKIELKSKKYIYIYIYIIIIKLLQVGQWLDFFDSTHCPIQHNFQHFIICSGRICNPSTGIQP